MLITLIFLIPFCAQNSAELGLIAAVLAGLVVDLWYASPLGSTSLTLLLVAFIINWYKNKFNAANPVFLYFFSFLVFAVIMGMQKRQLTFGILWLSAQYAVLIIPIFFVTSSLWKKTKQEEKKSI